MKLSDSQLEKTSEYLLDVSKLLIGATFVSIFAPGALGGLNLWAFSIGIILAAVFLIGALKILPKKL